MWGVAKLASHSSYGREPQDTHHFTHAFCSANATILQKDSEVSLFESEIEIEMKRHKIISIIEIESEKAKLILSNNVT